ncbi:MAG: hypothetical protein HY791_22340 [Deltaproteobacteria bacterium]|nr:hypothetical protein [Deltaproteobacteria bacterium]
MAHKNGERRADRPAASESEERDRSLEPRIAEALRQLNAAPRGSDDEKRATRELARCSELERRRGEFASARQTAAAGQRRSKRLRVEEALAAIGEGRWDLAAEAAAGYPELAEVVGALEGVPKRGKHRSQFTRHLTGPMKVVAALEAGDTRQAERAHRAIRSVPPVLAPVLEASRLEFADFPDLKALRSLPKSVLDLATRAIAGNRPDFAVEHGPGFVDDDLWVRSALQAWRADRGALLRHLGELNRNLFTPSHSAGAELYQAFATLADDPDQATRLFESALAAGADSVECLRGLAMAARSSDRPSLVRNYLRLSRELEARGAPELAMGAMLLGARQDASATHEQAQQHAASIRALAERVGMMGPLVEKRLRLLQATRLSDRAEAVRVCREVIEENSSWIPPWQLLLAIHDQDPAKVRELSKEAFLATGDARFELAPPTAASLAGELIAAWKSSPPKAPFELPPAIRAARAELSEAGRTALDLVRVGLLAELGDAAEVVATLSRESSPERKSWLLAIAGRSRPELFLLERLEHSSKPLRGTFAKVASLAFGSGAVEGARRLFATYAAQLDAGSRRETKSLLKRPPDPHRIDTALFPFHEELGPEICLFEPLLEQSPADFGDELEEGVRTAAKALLENMPKEMRRMIAEQAHELGVPFARFVGESLKQLSQFQSLDALLEQMTEP